MTEIKIYLTKDEASKLSDRGYIEWSDNDNSFVTTGVWDSIIRRLLKEGGFLS